MTVASTLVVSAHNEESYIEQCLHSILDQTVRPTHVILVADRCTDRTLEIARSLLPPDGSTIIEKDRASWHNSYSENLEIARQKARQPALFIVDADVQLPPDFVEKLIPQLDAYASVSAAAETDPKQGMLNRVVSSWEKTRRLAPFGEQPRGAARVVSLEALNKIGGFRDVIAVDSDLDIRLRAAGYKVKLDRNLTVLHRRRMTLKGSVRYQLQAGRARRELGISASRTILHSIGRLRPFVAYGYFSRSKPNAPAQSEEGD